MLTDAEKGDCLFFLGYPAKTLVVDSIDYSRRVAERFENLPDHIESRIKRTLKRLKEMDEKLETAADRFAIESIGDIKPNPRERELLVIERRRYALQLSGLLDLPIQSASSRMSSVCV